MVIVFLVLRNVDLKIQNKRQLVLQIVIVNVKHVLYLKMQHSILTKDVIIHVILDII